MKENELQKYILAINTLAYHSRSFEESFELIAKSGFTFVEPAFIANYYPSVITQSFFNEKNGLYFASQIKLLNLKMYSVGVHFTIKNYSTGINYLKQRLDFSVALGAKVIISNGAVLEAKSDFLKCIDEVSYFLQDNNIILSLENPGCGEKNNIIATGKMGAELIKEIDNPHVRLNYDPSNVYSYSRASVLPEKDDYKHALPYCKSLHLKQLQQDKQGMFFSSINKGVTNFQTIIKDYVNMHDDAYMVLELPLNHRRNKEFSITQSNSKTIPISHINKIVKDSVLFVSHVLN